MKKFGAIAVVIGLAFGSVFLGASLLPQREGSTPAAAQEVNPLELSPGLAGEDLDATIAALRSRINRGGVRVAGDHASLAFAFLQKARVEAKPELYDDAEVELDRSLELQPEQNFSATIGKAILAGSRHDFRGQKEWAERATEINPAHSQALGIVGDAAIELGEMQEAERVYQQMLDLRPDLPSWGRVSYLKSLQGDSASAIRSMEQALRFAGSGADDAWASWQLGELQMGSGRLERAGDLFSRALIASPGFGPAREASAHLAAATGDLPKAASILTELTSEIPLPGDIAFLGDIHLLMGDEDAAEETYAEADARLFEYMSHGVAVDVDFVTFWADRGLHLDRALSDARKLYRERQSAAVSDALAWALYANGRFSEADRYAREALARSEGDPGFLFHAGMIALELDQEGRARRLLEEALESDPAWSILDADRARATLSGR